MASPPKATILVTGGGGYIGSHSILSLLESGYEVVAIDNFTNSVQDVNAEDKSSPSTLPESLVRVSQMTGKKVYFFKADMRDVESLRVPFRCHKIDAVIHFAALKAVGESMSEPLKYYKTNVSGTCNLMEVMEEFDCQKIVFSSSSCVYGDPEYLPIDEKHPTGKNCANPYGRSKYISEEIMADICKANGKLGVMLLRYFNPVGAHPSGQIGEDPAGVPANLMPYISQVAVGRRPKLMVYGSDYDTPDGTGVRDYIHIMDLADGHTAAVKKILTPDFKGVSAYNLGTGHGISVLEMVKAFEKATDIKVPIEMAPRRPGDIACAYATAALAEKELGWKTKYTLEEMCRDSWNWQSKNPKGFLNQ